MSFCLFVLFVLKFIVGIATPEMISYCLVQSFVTILQVTCHLHANQLQCHLQKKHKKCHFFCPASRNQRSTFMCWCIFFFFSALVSTLTKHSDGPTGYRLPSSTFHRRSRVRKVAYSVVHNYATLYKYEIEIYMQISSCLSPASQPTGTRESGIRRARRN